MCASVYFVKCLPSLYHDVLLSRQENCSWRCIKLIYIKLVFSDRIVCMHAQLIWHYEGLKRISDTQSIIRYTCIICNVENRVHM